MRRKISQREAHRTARELRDLYQEFSAFKRRFGSDYPGTFFWRIPGQEKSTQQQFSTVQKLGFCVAARIDGDGAMQLYAVKP